MSRDAIILDTALDAPPEAVWRALTEPALMARWLAAGDIRAVVGERFTLRPGGPAGEAANLARAALSEWAAKRS